MRTERKRTSEHRIGRIAFLLLTAISAACDVPARPQARSAATVADSAPGVIARPDSPVVSTAPRPRRLPARLERAAGDLQLAANAVLLRETLVASVVDERGRPVEGVAVSWAVAVGGGRLLSTEPLTDRQGLARARWELGTTAGQQVVMATVAPLGAVGFRASLDVASVVARPRNVNAWVGDTVMLHAARLDSAGRELSGAPFRWRAADEAIAYVAPHGLMTARRAGSTFATAVEGDRSITVPITVLPVAAGRIVSADGSPVGGHRIHLRTDVGVDSVDVDVSGDFAFRLTGLATRNVEVRVEEPGDGSGRFFPAHVRLTSLRSLERVHVVLMPRQWTIATGTFAGRTVPIDPAAALRLYEGSPGFWRVARATTGRGWAVGWETTRWPVPLAFRRGRGDRIEPSDSAAFWSIVRRLEADLGRTFFRPADIADLTGDTLGLVVEVIPALATAGRTLVSWDQRGSISDGEVAVSSRSLLGSQRVVTHELMHAIGFGHTTAWTSVMGPPEGVDRPTATDAAHAQLLLAVREAQHQFDAPYGILEAVPGEVAVRIGARPPIPR